MVYLHYAATLFLAATVATSNASDDIDGHRHRRLSVTDEARAYMPVPPHGSPLLSVDPEEVSENINAWLRNALPEEKLKRCEDFQDVDELNQVLETILEMKHPELQNIYKRNCDNDDGCDNRALRFDSLEEYKQDWDSERLELHVFENHDKIGQIMNAIARKGKCARAVMWFQHHLSQDSREVLMERDGFHLPLMPEHVEEFDEWLDHLEEMGDHGRKLYKKFTEDPYDNDGPMNCRRCHVM